MLGLVRVFSWNYQYWSSIAIP